VGPDREHRARLHAALGEEHRLAIVDELAVSDRSPTELGRLLDLPTNLLAHHLDVLDEAGLIERFASTGDRRRRYVRLVRASLTQLGVATARPVGTLLFICSQNSARSQLAAVLWRDRTGGSASSAGTRPAEQVHPGAVAAAHRAGLDLSGARPRLLASPITAEAVVTVCDLAHEELEPDPGRWHWSIPDPVEADTDAAFDAVVADLDSRISSLTAAGRKQEEQK
jgi:protein-tyrosine-phosphatase